jgi:hypothetical protein
VRRRCIAAFLLVSAAFGAEATTPQRPAKKRWWVSVAAVAAASFADMHSSWGRRELNPMLRGPDGRFGTRGAAVKSSIVGASCGLQWLLLERKPHMAGVLSGANWGLAAWSAGVAARNRRN